MNTFAKAGILGSAGKFDSCGPKMCEVNVREGLGGVYHAKAEHQTCKIFKTLMTNKCNYDCKYCSNAKCGAKNKTEYEPEELSKLFKQLRLKLNVNGLFLSSGVSKDADTTTEKMIEAVKLVRKDFSGYLHFKVLPGTSYDLIKQASELSTRMSINIEAPRKDVLSELSTCKDYKIDILRRQAWIKRMGLGAGQTTQMIVNDMATDKDVIKMASWEYDKMELKRVYYSAFTPVKGTELEGKMPESMTRERHLYNTDFLMRDYGYSAKEFYQIMDDGMLPSEDPKLALARETIDSPVDINEAVYEELIRIPGIGPKSARRITARKQKIRKYRELKEIGCRVNIARPFISVDGKSQTTLNHW